MSPETGRRFGPYEIQSRLGGGGMGHVYQAWDARLHREVAIKLLQNDYAMPGMRERFLREARAASALNHPNICTIFDIGEQNGDPYLVMELLEGETLRDRIQERTLQTEEICCIGREIADALGAAHAKGVIHRDVKPANIFLVQRPNGSVQAKVLDFGLAKIEGGVLGGRGSRSLDITTAGSTVGTLAYMSPEQARGEMLDSRSDLFSLGVVLYEMATRHVPFKGATSALVFVQLLNHSPEPVREWNESIPRDLEKIIFKLLSKERTARFQTAQDLMAALSAVTEKGSSGPGNWLRKAVSTVPLVRPADATARERRAGRKRSEESGEQGTPADPTPQPAAGNAPSADPTPRPSGEAQQFIRPVARLPRGDATPRPSVSTPSPEAQRTAESVAVASSSSSGVEAAPAPAPTPAPAEAPAVKPAHASATRLTRNYSEQAKLAAAAVQPEPQAASPVLAVAETARPAAAVEPSQPPAAGPARLSRWITPKRLILSLSVLLLVLAGTILLLSRGHFRPTLLTDRDSVLMTEIENRTGNKVLDHTLEDSLGIALRQSPYLQLRDPQTYRIARRVAGMGPEASAPIAAREIARKVGATAYLLGSVRGDSAPYIIHVDLLNAASGDVITSVEESVSSLGEMPGAVDRVANDLRSNVGEEDDSISRSGAPLSREATSNLDALHLFSLGETQLAANQSLDAIRSYQDAVTLEPRFSLAYLRLAFLYRHQRAEVAAANAARLALAGADGASERTRTLAQYEYEMNATGDFQRATGIIRHYLADAPRDPDALEALARTLRLQGHMSEALQTAQQAYTLEPYSVEAYRQAQDALIGLDRYDAAFQLEGQVERLGVSRVGGALTAAYLEGRADLVAEASAAFERRKAKFAPDWTYGIYLDNGGRLDAGTALWRFRASQAEQIPELASAAPLLLAQGALDRALVGDCPIALQMAGASAEGKQGITAIFEQGLTDALCGEADQARSAAQKLQAEFPQSFNVQGFYVADIRAAIALHDGDAAAAIELLKPARQFDLISLTPWLRGRAHVALHQVQVGIVDFQTVLAHRGSTFLVGSNVYPVAEIGVARAFADTGDLGNSAEAYRHFLDLWQGADKGQPLLTEARLHSR